MPATASAAGTGLDAYEVKTDKADLGRLAEEGFDVTEGRKGNTLEIIATRKQIGELRDLGMRPKLKRNDAGLTARQFAARRVAPDGSYDVYRPYFNDECTTETCYVGRDNVDEPRQTLYQELQAIAERTSLVRQAGDHRPHGQRRADPGAQVHQGRPADPDGSRPAVLYSSNQHAREWITPEMNRRLAHLFADNYTTVGDDTPAEAADGGALGAAAGSVTKGDITKLITENELWIVLSANPDGYDFTFTPGNRLWRKNLAELQRPARHPKSATASTRTATTRRSGTTTTRARRPIR